MMHHIVIDDSLESERQRDLTALAELERRALAPDAPPELLAHYQQERERIYQKGLAMARSQVASRPPA